MGTTKGNNQDDKPEIKINRKMRTWYKYKNYCFMAAGIVAVVVMLVVIVNLLPESKSGNQEASLNGETKDYVIQTEDATESNGPSETETESEAETEPQTETESQTQAPSVSDPQIQTFTSKDKFAGSVFVGDTIVNGIAYYGHLSESQVNSSINMVSNNVKDRVNDIMSSNPGKVFIMVGLNDANYGNRTTDYIVDNIGKAVAAIKAKNSSTQVYVLSVLPIGKEYESKSNVLIRQSFLDELNYKLSTRAASMNASYIDVATAFKDGSGYMHAKCTSNGYSLKKEYYPYLLNRIADGV